VSATLPYKFVSDSGHGWLEVPYAEVKASGARITAYSYYDRSTGLAYLEEDMDASSFLRAIGALGNGPVRFKAEQFSSFPRGLSGYPDPVK
jgi:hypothetical protein